MRDFNVSSVIYRFWYTVGLNGASITRGTNGTVIVYKDNGTTESSAGVTDTEDFDGRTGVHLLTIDTSADGTFYSSGGQFEALVHTMTVDGQGPINMGIDTFTLGMIKASIDSILSDTNDIQTRLPAALVGGRIDASVGAMAANVLTAAATAADFTTEIQVGLATGVNLALVQTDVDDIQARLPAALTANGNMKSDTLRINGTAVQGAGVLGNAWRPV